MAIDKEKARETILHLTLKKLESAGLEGTKARDLASEAGVSVGSLYNIFGDLDQLIMTANSQTYDDLTAAAQACLTDARSNNFDILNQLYGLSETYIRFIEENNNRWMAVLNFNRSKSKGLPKWYTSKQYLVFGIIEDVLSELDGLSNPEERSLTARALWASVHGIVTNVYSHRVGDERAKKEAWSEIRVIVPAVVQSLSPKETIAA